MSPSAIAFPEIDTVASVLAKIVDGVNDRSGGDGGGIGGDDGGSGDGGGGEGGGSVGGGGDGGGGVGDGGGGEGRGGIGSPGWYTCSVKPATNENCASCCGLTTVA